MWALVCIFNHFSCLMVDCPHLLILSFYSTSSLLYVSLSSSGLRCIIIKLTTDSFLRTRSHFIYICSELFSCSRLGNRPNCGVKRRGKNPQLDNVKVSQERHRGSTKEALSLARRVHVTRSVLPNLGNNTEARIHWAHSRLSFFSCATFKIYKARQKTPNVKEGPQS